MAHQIETANGQATAAYWRDAAWHKLGVVLDEELSATAALSAANIAGLDYRMEPMYTAGGLATGRFGIVSNHPFTGERRYVGGAVTEDYVLEVPEDLATFADALVDGGAHMSAIALLNQGRRMFVSMHVTDLLIGGVDRTAQHLLVYTAFDGSCSTNVKLLNFRVECGNMLNLATTMQVEHQFRQRHNTPLTGRVMRARETLDLAFAASLEFGEMAERLLDQTVTDDQFRKIVDAFLPEIADGSKKAMTRRETDRGDVFQNYLHGAESSITGTAWGAFNALTDWIDHSEGQVRTPQARALTSFMDDRPDTRKREALRVVQRVLV